MLMPNLTPHRSPEPLTPQSRACVCAAPIYREMGRDEPVFLSARLLAYTSMEPRSECHLMVIMLFLIVAGLYWLA